MRGGQQQRPLLQLLLAACKARPRQTGVLVGCRQTHRHHSGCCHPAGDFALRLRLASNSCSAAVEMIKGVLRLCKRRPNCQQGHQEENTRYCALPTTHQTATTTNTPSVRPDNPRQPRLSNTLVLGDPVLPVLSQLGLSLSVSLSVSLLQLVCD